MHILWSILLGFLAGLIARAVYPGANPMGFVATTLLGIVGSVVGGLVAMFIWKPKAGAKFHPGGLLLSILGAILVLFLYQRLF
ncbi:MAG: GlsB/YeaQ/YmgE family stress response membrane protein [Acidobacteriia bacterium]|nr:GlsB/YeaQ/YmgE family stress response membrane protein [Terriglobia bacterium]